LCYITISRPCSGLNFKDHWSNEDETTTAAAAAAAVVVVVVAAVDYNDK